MCPHLMNGRSSVSTVAHQRPLRDGKLSCKVAAADIPIRNFATTSPAFYHVDLATGAPIRTCHVITGRLKKSAPPISFNLTHLQLQHLNLRGLRYALDQQRYSFSSVVANVE